MNSAVSVYSYIILYFFTGISCLEQRTVTTNEGSTSVQKTTDLPDTSRTTITSEVIIVLDFEHVRLTLPEGKLAWFEFQVHSSTLWNVRWFHGGNLITSSSTRYTMTSHKTENGTSSHTLYIASVLPRDGGEWKIIASSQEFYASRHLTVTVIPRLVLQLTPQYDFSIPLGEEIHLQCKVINPVSLMDLGNGSLVLKKDGNFLSDVSNTNFSAMWNTLSATSDHSGRYTCLHTGYNIYSDPVFASVYITVIEPEQIRCDEEESEGIFWNITLAGTTKKVACPANQRGMATRYCETNGKWGFPILVNCTNEAFVNASSQLDIIIEDGIQNRKTVQGTVNSTLKLMKNLTSSTNEISPGDLSSSLDILEKIVDVTNSTGLDIEKEAFYAVIDNVLSTNNSKSWSIVIEKVEKDASSLLKNMERFSEVLILSDNITATQFNGSNFGLTINQTDIDETGILFPDISSNNLLVDFIENSTYLELPKQKTEKAIKYVAVMYKTMSAILPSNSDLDQNSDSQEETPKKSFVNSQILSLTTQTDLRILVPPLNLTFQHTNSTETPGMHAICVSWDFTARKWTDKGCKVNQSDHKRTVCQCNHLTNFAILMRPYSPVVEDRQSLKMISLIGMAISITFTFLTFIIYTMTWRFIRSDQNIILLNLCGSLISSYAMFISLVDRTGNEVVCTAVTAILHYFFLVTFFSMLGMGIYYFMSITVTYYAMYVANNFKARSRVHWFLVGIWGIPVIITATNLGVFWGKGYHLKNYCWLSMDGGSLYLFIVPVCSISILNLLIIVSLVRVLCGTSVMSKSSLHKKATSGLRSLGTLLPVLGVTWVFGILAVNENADVFQYIFVGANSLQGFFIFISHVLMNKKVMQGLRTKYPVCSTCKRRAERSNTETVSVSVSRNQSTTKSDGPLIEERDILRMSRKSKTKQKVKKSESFMTEKTMYTDFQTSSLKENSSEMSINRSALNKIQKMGIISDERDKKRMFRWLFSFNTQEENVLDERYVKNEEKC